MSAQLAQDVGVVLRLLKDGSTDPEVWTVNDRAAVTRLHVLRDAEQANAQEADKRQPVPGVYSEAQGNPPVDYTAPAPREAWLEGYRYALLNPTDPGVVADAARYRVEAISAHVDELAAERTHLLDRRVGELLADRVRTERELDRARHQVDSLEARLSTEKRAHDRLAELLDHQARELADACTLEGALRTLGITRGQLDAGQAVDLCGHPYVSRDLLAPGSPGPVDAEAPGPLSDTLPRLNVEGTALLTEAAGGVFVPIPEGHMLSVTVTPYAAD